MRRNGFYMHNRGRYFVQQLSGGGGAAVGWSFVAPQTNGFVRALVSDGAGGWYMGGNFTSVTDSVATYTTGYACLVRLDASGNVDASFSCPVNSSVLAIAVDSTGVYIGGLFSGSNSVGTSTRNRIARVRPFNDPSPGAVDAWNPGVNFGVNALVLDSANGKLYAGGSFSLIGGSGTDNPVTTTRSKLARFPTGSTGTVDAWNPGVPGGSDFVNALAFDAVNGKLYVGGYFDSIGGTSGLTTFDINPAQTRRGVCRLGTGVTATLDQWNPNVVQSLGNSQAVSFLLYDAANSKLYIGGGFVTIGASLGVDITPATTRNRIARLTTGVSATLDAWNPNVSTASSFVQFLAHDTTNGYIYLGGNFATVGGTARNCMARVSDGATATLDMAWDPDVSTSGGGSAIRAILPYPVPSKLIIAGGFDTIVNHVDTLGVDVAGLDT